MDSLTDKLKDIVEHEPLGHVFEVLAELLAEKEKTASDATRVKYGSAHTPKSRLRVTVKDLLQIAHRFES